MEGCSEHLPNGSGMIGGARLQTRENRQRAMSDPSRRYSELDFDDQFLLNAQGNY
jgi:hypothetical protein